jgi:hypothetical protein
LSSLLVVLPSLKSKSFSVGVEDEAVPKCHLPK